MSHIAIVGAGVIGVSTAYILARAGHRITLIDSENSSGKGASAGNAAQLSWAYGDAMASPALIRHLPAIALGRDPAFRIQWQADLDFVVWGLKFLANSTAKTWWANTRAILDLAAVSRHELSVLLAETELSFDYRVAGKLHLYGDTSSFNASRSKVEKKNALGLDQRMLDRAAAEMIEPALRHYQSEIAGAIYTPGDALGDAAAYCRSLTDHLIYQYGIETLFNNHICGFRTRAGAVTALKFSDRDDMEVEKVVLATGPETRFLVREVPELRAIRPVRGYSLTIPLGAEAPGISLTDVKRKLAFAALGDRFRVAGLADIVKPGAGFDQSRFEILRKSAAEVLPEFGHMDSGEICWSGERPMTPSSQPIIGPSKNTCGLYLNIGHGMLGWTLALGSARRLADIIAG